MYFFYLILIVLNTFGSENDTATLALTSCAAQTLHHANRRLLCVEAHNQIHFANIYPK